MIICYNVILTTLISAILPELSKNFVTVTVEAVQCPNLTQPPFRLTTEGKTLILYQYTTYI